MTSRSTFLCKLVGLFLMLAALSLAVHRQATLDALAALVHNPATLWTAGMLYLATGLALVLGHNIWSDGLGSAVVTIVGWTTLIRGVLLLSLSPQALAGLLACVHFDQLFYFYLSFDVILGAYLAYSGFKAASPRHA